MTTLCIIPARGGSKRVPGKNLMPLAGHPMLAYSIMHALSSKRVDEVTVSTDNTEIARVAKQFGASVIERPAELSNDTATSESALLHVLDTRRSMGLPEPDTVVFLQCTSPVRRKDDIDNAIELFHKEAADSVFSACENNRLIWGMTPNGPVSLTYDWKQRKREQDMEHQYRENGSIYVVKPHLLRSTNNRMGGRIRVYEMDYWSSFQVDTEEHAQLIDWLLRKPEYTLPPRLPQKIDLVVFDFDGVMTDNAAYIDSEGRELVRVQRGDGLGVDRLRALGIPMLILSTERNPVVSARAAKLRIDVVQNVSDKKERLQSIIAERGLAPENVVFVGNDVNDLGCFDVAGYTVAVADSHPELLERARHVLTLRGGNGAVRELCDFIAQDIESRKTPK